MASPRKKPSISLHAPTISTVSSSVLSPFLLAASSTISVMTPELSIETLLSYIGAPYFYNNHEVLRFTYLFEAGSVGFVVDLPVLINYI
jgi:hypothetical protein